MPPDSTTPATALPPIARRRQRLPSLMIVTNEEGVVVNEFHRDFWLQAAQEQLIKTVWWALNNRHQVTIQPPELE